jgi:hypothetical protein
MIFFSALEGKEISLLIFSLVPHILYAIAEEEEFYLLGKTPFVR